VTQEEVHWGVELNIHLNEKNHPQIPQKSDKVETKKHHEEGNLPLWVVSKTYENELHYCGEVILSHGFGMNYRSEDENEANKIPELKNRIFSLW
jgi:hypothetical protein